MLPDVYMCSSHEQLPEKFTDTPHNMRLICASIKQTKIPDIPCKAGMHIHHTKNYQSNILTFHLRLVYIYAFIT